VPGHEGIAGNETADLLARTGYEHPFTGPESACGISIGVAKRVVRNWTNRNHTKEWESTTGLKQAKAGHSARRTEDLVKLNRQIKMDSRTIHRTMSSKGTPFQIGIDG
jgi:ribonuclease HI